MKYTNIFGKIKRIFATALAVVLIAEAPNLTSLALSGDQYEVFFNGARQGFWLLDTEDVTITQLSNEIDRFFVDGYQSDEYTFKEQTDAGYKYIYSSNDTTDLDPSRVDLCYILKDSNTYIINAADESLIDIDPSAYAIQSGETVTFMDVTGGANGTVYFASDGRYIDENSDYKNSVSLVAPDCGSDYEWRIDTSTSKAGEFHFVQYRKGTEFVLVSFTDAVNNYIEQKALLSVTKGKGDTINFNSVVKENKAVRGWRVNGTEYLINTTEENAAFGIAAADITYNSNDTVYTLTLSDKNIVSGVDGAKGTVSIEPVYINEAVATFTGILDATGNELTTKPVQQGESIMLQLDPTQIPEGQGLYAFRIAGTSYGLDVAEITEESGYYTITFSEAMTRAATFTVEPVFARLIDITNRSRAYLEKNVRVVFNLNENLALRFHRLYDATTNPDNTSYEFAVITPERNTYYGGSIPLYTDVAGATWKEIYAADTSTYTSTQADFYLGTNATISDYNMIITSINGEAVEPSNSVVAWYKDVIGLTVPYNKRISSITLKDNQGNVLETITRDGSDITSFIKPNIETIVDIEYDNFYNVGLFENSGITLTVDGSGLGYDTSGTAMQGSSIFASVASETPDYQWFVLKADEENPGGWIIDDAYPSRSGAGFSFVMPAYDVQVAYVRYIDVTRLGSSWYYVTAFFSGEQAVFGGTDISVALLSTSPRTLCTGDGPFFVEFPVSPDDDEFIAWTLTTYDPGTNYAAFEECRNDIELDEGVRLDTMFPNSTAFKIYPTVNCQIVLAAPEEIEGKCFVTYEMRRYVDGAQEPTETFEAERYSLGEGYPATYLFTNPGGDGLLITAKYLDVRTVEIDDGNELTGALQDNSCVVGQYITVTAQIFDNKDIIGWSISKKVNGTLVDVTEEFVSGEFNWHELSLQVPDYDIVVTTLYSEEFLAAGSEVSAGATNLGAEKKYVLAAGSRWRVNDDRTVYMGGVNFYVPETAVYIFEKVE